MQYCITFITAIDRIQAYNRPNGQFPAYLVRVRAQVMCRDEGTGGWVALGGGGLADVMVGKRARTHRASGEHNNY
ncbi:hypothetical protein HF086_002603 [Spodoptera exigua]|uniref:Uncharacterized protein n=1 Tax=Spodoptera exigua TaxID=7107 RepID=A0A922MH91_SPOEX|nr:hypothetical protein HF086_002603 [Spodoptera exigua]